jgi:uncharacterized delta-60 repeat protein
MRTGALIRLNANGSLDPAFTLEIGLLEVYAIHVLSDGRILVGGEYSISGSSTGTKLVRLLPDGSVDPMFNIGSGPNMAVHAILTDELGRIYIGGDFNFVNGVPRSGLARLDPDGALENEYVPDQSGVPVHAMSLDAQGRLLVQRHGQFVRLNEDGSLDQSYAMTMVAGFVSAVLAFTDGSVLIGGFIHAINMIPYAPHILKLDPMGVPDPSYMIGDGPDNWVQALTMVEDGKVMMGGWFRNVDGQPYKGIARLNINGSLDGTFASMPGIQDAIHPGKGSDRWRVHQLQRYSEEPAGQDHGERRRRDG